jgi:hypothetical protein
MLFTPMILAIFPEYVTDVDIYVCPSGARQGPAMGMIVASTKFIILDALAARASPHLAHNR